MVINQAVQGISPASGGLPEASVSQHVKVERIPFEQLTASEKSLIDATEIARYWFYTALHGSSDIRASFYKDCRSRAVRIGNNPNALAAFANNVAIEFVRIAKNKEVRSIINPDDVVARGGMCIERAFFAEAAMQYMYSSVKNEISFGGSTSIMLCIGENTETGKEFTHAVLLQNYWPSDNRREVSSLVLDPMAGIVDTLENFESGEMYADFEQKIVKVLGNLTESELVTTST